MTLVLASWASASEVELTAESVSVSDDSTVTSYIGDVVLRVPPDMHAQFKAKTTREESGRRIYAGDVEIVIDDLVIRTQKATLIAPEGAGKDVVVEMDEAQATVTKK